METCFAVLTCNPCFVFCQGPRCPAKCRDRTTAPAPAGEARILNKGNRYRRNRSGSKHSPKRRRPRSRVKPLLNFQLVPRGKERQKVEYGPEELQRLFVKLKASPLVPRGCVKLYLKRLKSHRHCHFTEPTERWQLTLKCHLKEVFSFQLVCLSRSASCSATLSPPPPTPPARRTSTSLGTYSQKKTGDDRIMQPHEQRVG